MFQNRKLLIATKHNKESVIAPLFEKELGVTCFVDEVFDTDTLGTFSGEIERELDPVSTARKKCLRAMKLNNCDLGIASEGSFGPHPSMIFVNADDEFLIFIDKLNNIEVIVREISCATNFNGKQIQSEKDLFDFAALVGFPSHGLILRKSKDDFSELFKGITDVEILRRSFESLSKNVNAVYVETDMRAMFNPTRMTVIQKAAEKLLLKIKSVCPTCSMPGFGVTSTVKGLKCSLCGSPTNSILSYRSVCQHCDFTREDIYPNGKTEEEPMYCNFCNP